MTAPTAHQPHVSEIEEWETISFIPTVGWTNHFTATDGNAVSTPCPGVLVQELRSITDIREVPRGDGTFGTRRSTRLLDAPYQTRTVVAELEFGALIPADDITGYTDTTMPGQTAEPDHQADEADPVQKWMEDRIIAVLAERGPMTANEIENAVFEDLTGYPGPTNLEVPRD